MAKPINLNRVRKERARKDAREAADRNAAFHGLTKAEKQRARAEAERVEKLHDEGRVEPEDGSGKQS
ncbi:DUF4169 family protein [Tropicimonas sp. TH_r6]|uniref:DUF4169 family protein n=1 Tax=Tropicimonas sp. TH_r6 TaxID=3082085 RepID=UPI002952E7A2|nr:DUF4169 family protein [Tropicimonas sp. TH_r6]MDV7141732.1 DUF4169 family protein [Tropicimonas sp. TH_r6]